MSRRRKLIIKRGDNHHILIKRGHIYLAISSDDEAIELADALVDFVENKTALRVMDR